MFEWLGWYQSSLPKFMSPMEFRENRFAVSTNHQPIWPGSKFNVHETTEQYYERCFHVTREILKKHEHEGEFNDLLWICLNILESNISSRGF